MTLQIIYFYIALLLGGGLPQEPPSDPSFTQVVGRAIGLATEDDSTDSAADLPPKYPQVPLGWRKVTLD